MAKELLRLEHIDKFYGSRQILEDLNLTIHENEFLTLLGPSGCGKTTTLRLIGGFELPDKGRILFDGQDITKLPPEMSTPTSRRSRAASSSASPSRAPSSTSRRSCS